MSPLAKISSTFGPRFAEFAFEPAFTAAVDQHVAEIRDRLSANHPGLIPPPPHREDLTDYALGFLDALAEIDWRGPVQDLGDHLRDEPADDQDDEEPISFGTKVAIFDQASLSPWVKSMARVVAMGGPSFGR